MGDVGLGRGVGEGGGGRKSALPGLRDDDVVEGGVAFAEAGEADLEDHGLLGESRVFWS